MGLGRALLVTVSFFGVFLSRLYVEGAPPEVWFGGYLRHAGAVLHDPLWKTDGGNVRGYHCRLGVRNTGDAYKIYLGRRAHPFGRSIDNGFYVSVPVPRLRRDFSTVPVSPVALDVRFQEYIVSEDWMIICPRKFP